MANYMLLNDPLKITHSFEYTINPHLRITVAKKSMLLPIVAEDSGHQIGFYYDGPIGFTADFIVHTNKGAVGHTFERSYSCLFMFPSDIDFLVEYVKKAKPLNQDEFKERYAHVLKTIRFNFSLINKLNDSRGKHYLFFTKKPFNLWVIDEDKTFYIAPPRIIGREGDQKLFMFSVKELIFVDSNKRVFSTAEFYHPKLIMQKLKEWLISLEPSPFTMLFRYFYDLT